MPNLLDLGVQVVQECRAQCGCTAIGYYETGLSLPDGTFTHGEPKLGFVPCGDPDHEEAAHRVSKRWGDSEVVDRFFGVAATESFITLFEEEIAD